MKVLYIHELYPPELVGGGEIYAENLVTELNKRGISVMVLTGTKGKTITETRNGIKVKRIHFNTRRQFMLKTKEIEKTIEQFKPDIIHTNAFTACIPAYKAAKKYKLPVIVNLHFLFQKEYYRYYKPLKAMFFSAMERRILKKPYDKFIALSYEIYLNLCKLGYKDKTVLIEHPINTKIFKPGKKSSKFTIGSQITLGPSKRIDLFTDLSREMKDVNFLTVGSITPELKKEFDICGIKYIGRLPHNQMPKFYNKINVYFGHGMAAKEAMACGCIAILNEETPRLLNYHKKELAAGIMLKGDPVKIINKLMKDKKYYNIISKRSVKFIRDNYDTSIIMPKIINVYNELAKHV